MMLIMIDDACTAIKHHVLLLSWTPFDAFIGQFGHYFEANAMDEPALDK